jgi:hypothetical protein
MTGHTFRPGDFDSSDDGQSTYAAESTDPATPEPLLPVNTVEPDRFDAPGPLTLAGICAREGCGRPLRTYPLRPRKYCRPSCRVQACQKRRGRK